MRSQFVKCTLVSLTIAVLFVSTRASYVPGDLGVAAGVHSAGLLGNYAGTLSGGKALSELDLGKSHDSDIELETHDFSEYDASKLSSDEHVGSTLGDHLSAHSFPADYGSDGDEHTTVYTDEGNHEVAEASEIHAHEHVSLGEGDFEQHNQLHDFSQHHYDHEELSLHGHEELFDTKPVPGIDHGKGAFSYSTLYEFKDKHIEE